MKFKTFLASEHMPLDSNVITGGGTDVTDKLQQILDLAGDDCGVRLIMDGAALIGGLDLSSNTVIECMSKDCGFYLKDDANRSVISNKIWDLGNRQTRNISLIGGTYNQNCLHQKHDVSVDKHIKEVSQHSERQEDMPDGMHWVFGIELYGVENFLMRDLTICDFRTYAVMIGGFKKVTIEDVWLALPHRMHSQNQDGFHFWGPGEFLTIRNVGGMVGDDFMNLGPDEHDGSSSITDVLVDGVFLEHADQAVRMLNYGDGRLDRVTLRNISGTYRSFGFYINCWFPGNAYGNYGNIFIENVDLRQETPNYNYRAPMLFSVGCNIESLTIKNVRHHMPTDNRTLFELGIPFHDLNWQFPEGNLPHMKNVLIQDLTIIEEGEQSANGEYIQVYLPIDHLIIRDVYLTKEQQNANGCFITFKKQGRIHDLIMNDVYTFGLERLVDEEEKVNSFIRSNVINIK